MISPFIFAVLIAYILNPIVKTLTKKRIHRVIAIITIYLTVIGIIITILVYIIPILILELYTLKNIIPFYTDKIRRGLVKTKAEYFELLPANLQKTIDGNIIRLEEQMLGLLQKITGSIIAIIPGTFTILLGPILGFYLLKDLDKIKKSLLSYISTAHKSIALRWCEKLVETLGQYVKGQLIVALIIGLLTTFSMLILNVDFALLIGILAGVTNIIPYFGPIVGAIPAIIIAILRYPHKIPWVIISVLIIHQLESGIISPYIVGSHVGIHPITVISSLLVGGTLFGFPGLIFAVPMAALIKLMLQNRKNRV